MTGLLPWARERLTLAEKRQRAASALLLYRSATPVWTCALAAEILGWPTTYTLTTHYESLALDAVVAGAGLLAYLGARRAARHLLEFGGSAAYRTARRWRAFGAYQLGIGLMLFDIGWVPPLGWAAFSAGAALCVAEAARWTMEELRFRRCQGAHA